MSEIFTPLDYVMQYGGRCRDCADHDGICPGDFMPCDTGTKRSAVAWVIGALEYGRKHGYIVDPPTPPPVEGFAAHGEYERAVGGETARDAHELATALVSVQHHSMEEENRSLHALAEDAAQMLLSYSARLASSSGPEPGPEGFDEQVPVKRTMTLSLTQAEMDALEEIAKRQDMSPPTVFRQALKGYQLISRGLADLVMHDEQVPKGGA
jgi:hypothetical protein